MHSLVSIISSSAQARFFGGLSDSGIGIKGSAQRDF